MSDVTKPSDFLERMTHVINIAQVLGLITVIHALFIDSKTSKYLMRFLHYAFFLAKSHVSVLFSWPLSFCRIE